MLSLLPILTQSVMACPLWMQAGLINVGVLLLATGPGGPRVSCLGTHVLAEFACVGYTEHNNRAHINTERYSAGDGGGNIQKMPINNADLSGHSTRALAVERTAVAQITDRI